MSSAVTDDFRSLFAALPVSVQAQARRAYTIWKHNPFYPSLHFKQVHATEPLWFIGLGW